MSHFLPFLTVVPLSRLRGFVLPVCRVCKALRNKYAQI